MDELVTTCVQQQIRVYESHGEFRNDIQRFMRLAKVKESRLVIFPELGGLLLAPPLVPGLKRTLLRAAERQVKRKPSLIDRMVGRMASSASNALGGISASLSDVIVQHESTLRDAYLTIFSEVAREHSVYLVGGSIYLLDSQEGRIHNTTYLFSPTGEVIGQQAKMALDPLDRLFCQPAAGGLEVFETDFGRLGILLGQDALYPETCRVLANKGAQFVVHLAASTSQERFIELRHAFASRVQENYFLGAQSYLVGKNILNPNEGDYVGKSAVMAPFKMTTRHSGLLGEVGSMVSEGIISSTWDLKGLYELRRTTDTPTQIPLTHEALARQIVEVYSKPEETAPVGPRPLRHPAHIAPLEPLEEALEESAAFGSAAAGAGVTYEAAEPDRGKRDYREAPQPAEQHEDEESEGWEEDTFREPEWLSEAAEPKRGSVELGIPEEGQELKEDTTPAEGNAWDIKAPFPELEEATAEALSRVPGPSDVEDWLQPEAESDDADSRGDAAEAELPSASDWWHDIEKQSQGGAPPDESPADQETDAFETGTSSSDAENERDSDLPDDLTTERGGQQPLSPPEDVEQENVPLDEITDEPDEESDTPDEPGDPFPSWWKK